MAILLSFNLAYIVPLKSTSVLSSNVKALLPLATVSVSSKL